MRKNVLLFCLIFIILSTCGCYNIRKKFVRKKKYQQETPVYVAFKDYPTKPSREAYVDYYLFVKGWLEDLAEALRKGSSFKREKRAINEAIMNLEQIISFYNEEGKNKIYPLYEELLAIKKKIEGSPNMNEVRRGAIIGEIEHVKRKFEAEFNYTDAEKWMD
jgi:predicted RND superfamily exporter protein